MKYVRWIAMMALATALAMPGCRKDNGNSQGGSDEQSAPADPMKNKGIGPISSLELAAIDPSLAQKGAGLFEIKCSSCHKLDERHVGPALRDVTTRRSPEWIMNMILNPQEMIEKDPIAEDLFATFMTPMANQNLTQDEARAVLEYLRSEAGK